jgi:hypothetical protein
VDVRVNLLVNLARVSGVLVGLSEAGVLRTLGVTVSAVLATLVALH